MKLKRWLTVAGSLLIAGLASGQGGETGEGAQGADKVQVDGIETSDPDFRSQGDIDFIRCTFAATPDPACLEAEDVIGRVVGGGAAVADGAITEPKLKVVGAPTDGYCLTYETAGGGDFAWVPCASGGGHTIQEDGTPLTQRTGLNFTTNITCVDDAANNRTNCSALASGDSIQVETGDNGGTFTTLVDADFEDSGDIDFVPNTATNPDQISAQIRANAITTTELANDAVTNPDIGTAAVGADEIATDAVGADEIAVGAVGTSEAANLDTGDMPNGNWLPSRIVSGSATNKCAKFDGSGVLIAAAADCGTGGGTITVEEQDASPSYSGISTIIFEQADGFTVTNPTAGKAKIDYQLVEAAGTVQAGVIDGGAGGDIQDGTIIPSDLDRSQVYLWDGFHTWSSPGGIIANGVDIDFEGGASEGFPRIASSTTPPAAACDAAGDVGHLYLDADADTNGSLFVCTGPTPVWKDIDDDGGAGGLAGTDIDTSSELYTLVTDETGSASGTPLLVFNQSPVISGKIDRNNVSVDDDVCDVGDTGTYWYDTPDGRFEFCQASELGGEPIVLASGFFTLTADGGTPQNVNDGDTLAITGGTGITTTASATDALSIACDDADDAGSVKGCATYDDTEFDVAAGVVTIGALATSDMPTGSWDPARVDHPSATSKCARFDASGVLVAAGADCGTGGTPHSVFDSDCTNNTGAVSGDLCIDTTGPNMGTLYYCSTATCEGAGWVISQREHTFSAASPPNAAGGLGTCDSGIAGACDCKVVYGDRYVDTTNVASFRVEEYICISSGTDVWMKVPGTPAFSTQSGDPTSADECFVPYTEFITNILDNSLWVCTDDSPNTWAKTSGGGGITIASDCSTSTAEGALCWESDTDILWAGTGAAVVPMPNIGDIAGVADNELLRADGATGKMQSTGVTITDTNDLLLPTTSGEAAGMARASKLRLRKLTANATGSNQFSELYAMSDTLGQAELRYKEFATGVYRIPSWADPDGSTAPPAFTVPFFSGGDTARLGDTKVSWQDPDLKVGWAGGAASSGMQFVLLDKYTTDTPTPGDCDVAAEVGRIAVKSGAGVTAGEGNVCACVEDAGGIGWVCAGTGSGDSVLITDGQDWCIDENSNGVACEENESNVTMNAPNNDTGDETVQGNLTVAEDLTVSGVTYMHETLVARQKSTSTAAPSPAGPNCYGVWWGTGATQASCNADLHSHYVSFKAHLTRFCFQSQVAATLGSGKSVELELYDGSSELAQISIADTGGDVTHAAGAVYCAAINATVNAGTGLQLRIDAGSETVDAWAGFHVEVYGYGVN